MPRPKTSRRPGPQDEISRSEVKVPPRLSACQPAPGSQYQWLAELSPTRITTSIRFEAQETAPGPEVRAPPMNCQPDQPVADGQESSQSEFSTPRPNTSRRPGSREGRSGSAVKVPPRLSEFQFPEAPEIENSCQPDSEPW